MSVKIRLSRVGRIHSPVYRIVVSDSRKPRNTSIENLGTYNPLNHKFIQFHEERLNHWVSNGAVLSDAVKKLVKSYKETKSA